MPKKWKSGEDTRGIKAKAQKSAAQLEREAAVRAERQAADDAFWSEGSNKRGAKKAADAARKAAEKEKRKAEKAALIVADDVELAKTKGVRAKGTKTGGRSKVAAKRAAMAELAALQASMGKGGATAEWSTGIDSALGALAGTKKASAVAERHPERRQKAAYRMWEEGAMAALKEDHPGLRRTQYKERLHALWQKSPDNPMNSADIVSYNAKVDDKAGAGE